MATITFLGLGAMGTRMAQRLLDAVHDLVVYNRTAARAEPLRAAGATVATTPRQAVAPADLVISMVTDDTASQNLWLDPDHGALEGLQPGTIALECSTLTPTWVRQLGAALAERGVSLLDAPVVGTRPHAEKGILTFCVGGDSETVKDVREVFDILGQAVHYAGPLGAGMTLKLIVNALFGIQVAALAEFIGILDRSELPVEETVQMLTSMPVTSPVLQRVAGLMMSGASVTNFPIDLVEKDLGYFGVLADEVGAAGPTTDAVRNVFNEARTAGLGGRDISGLVAHFRSTS